MCIAVDHWHFKGTCSLEFLPGLIQNENFEKDKVKTQNQSKWKTG